MQKKLISLMVLVPLLAGLLQAQTIPETTTSLEAYDMPGYFMVCRNTTQSVRLVEGGDQTPEGQWDIVPGLTGTGTVSFAPVALPNHYMRHRSYVLYADPAETAALFLGDASFTPVPGLADPEDPTLVSFRSQNYPNNYLIHGTPGNTIGFRIDPISTDDQRARATFRFLKETPELASEPVPANEATDVPRATSLGWTPGAFAAAHDVYLGTNFDDVNAATRGNPRNVLVSQGQAAATFSPSELLSYDTTYYWRIDEVNAPPSSTIFKGEVWSFTTEPLYYTVEDVAVTASVPTAPGSGAPEVIVDGSGLTDGLHGTVDNTMWSSAGAEGDPVWLQFDFDRVYKLYGMHVWNYNGQFEFILGFGFKDVTIEYATEPNEWMTLGDYELAKGTNLPNYAGQQIDLDGLVARAIRINVNSTFAGRAQSGLSEIQFLYKQVTAREPQPADGATDVDRAASLDWRSGREAATHQIHFGTDANTVAEGTALIDVVADGPYNPGPLTLGTTYYWKVDEVNEAETPTTWAGDVWSFITQEYVSIDNFESYTDDEGQEIFSTWVDGYFDNNNGSQVGNDNPPFVEKTIVHDGAQAMPLRYTNTGSVAYSEAELTLPMGLTDWTVNGADTLRLYYRGVPLGFVPISETNILMNGIGTDIWDTADQFRYVYKPLSGNGSIVARVDRIDRTDGWAKAGVMIRETLESDSPHAMIVVTPDNGISFQRRTTRGGTSANTDVAGLDAPYWVKLTRAGDTFTAQYSADDVTWVDLALATPLQITMPTDVYIGLAVTSHNANAVTGAEFSGVTTTGNVTGTWQSASIGVDQVAGNGIDRLYLTVEDTAGHKATVPNPDPYAIGAGSWQAWSTPLSDLSTAGVNVKSVAKVYIGVGDKTLPSKNVSGILYIDDIGFGHPMPAAGQ